MTDNNQDRKPGENHLAKAKDIIFEFNFKPHAEENLTIHFAKALTAAQAKGEAIALESVTRILDERIQFWKTYPVKRVECISIHNLVSRLKAKAEGGSG